MGRSRAPRPTWRLAYTALAAVPLIAVAMTLIDPPLWLLLVAIVISAGLLGAGTALLRRPGGGWLPSTTLPAAKPPQTDEH